MRAPPRQIQQHAVSTAFKRLSWQRPYAAPGSAQITKLDISAGRFAFCNACTPQEPTTLCRPLVYKRSTVRKPKEPVLYLHVLLICSLRFCPPSQFPSKTVGGCGFVNSTSKGQLREQNRVLLLQHLSSTLQESNFYV